MRNKWILASISTVLVLTATVVSAGITGTTGSVVQVSPPTTVIPGATESSTDILVFQEQGASILGSDVSVNISQPGWYHFNQSPTLTPGTLSAGTQIDGSYFLHLDPTGTDGVHLTGSVSFDCPVIGVNVLTTALDASDGLGFGGTVYPTGTEPFRGLDWEEGVVLSADRLTLTVDLDNYLGIPGGTAPDQIRVITACDIPGGEGCTPGYWKNHLESWTLPPGDDFDKTFDVDYFDPDITLGQAIRLGGGHEKKLARHGTAALLNHANPGVNYPLTLADLIVAVQVGDGDTLVEANELSDECPAVSLVPSVKRKKNKGK